MMSRTKNRYFLASAEGKRLTPDGSKRYVEELGAFMSNPATGQAGQKICVVRTDGVGAKTYRCFLDGVGKRVKKALP